MEVPSLVLREIYYGFGGFAYINHSKDNSFKLVNFINEHGKDANLLFYMHNVSRD